MARTLGNAAAMLTAVMLLLASRRSAAQPSFSVERYLQRPGVRLVAVEFYATWCQPCMAAVPKWQRLRERYYDDGLRLVVVAVRDAKAVECANLAWEPDEQICDLSGTILDSFGGARSLPAAFLWSWQGKLLVRRGHVDVVEKAVTRYLKRSARVLVEAFDAGRKPDASLRAAVRSELAREGRLLVVADAAERAALRRLRKGSHGPSRLDEQRCALGQEVSANSRLVARVVGHRGVSKLVVSLFSIERGCELTSVIVRWSKRRSSAAVREAVGALLANMRERPQHPLRIARRATTRSEAPVKVETFGAKDDWDPSARAQQKVVVQFRSKPAGSVVMVDRLLVCQSTPCSAEVTIGSHAVEMQRPRFLPRSQVLDIERNMEVRWTLDPNFATVSIRTKPAGIQVVVDGKAAGKAPLRDLQLAVGRHEFAVSDPCWMTVGKRVSLARGDVRTISLEPTARPSAIAVSAQDSKGNAVVADVWVDGVRLGATPNTFKLSVCSKEVVVKSARLGSWTRALELVEKKVTALSAVLGQARAEPAAAPTSPGVLVAESPVYAITVHQTSTRHVVSLAPKGHWEVNGRFPTTLQLSGAVSGTFSEGAVARRGRVVDVVFSRGAGSLALCSARGDVAGRLRFSLKGPNTIRLRNREFSFKLRCR